MIVGCGATDVQLKPAQDKILTSQISKLRLEVQPQDPHLGQHPLLVTTPMETLVALNGRANATDLAIADGVGLRMIQHNGTHPTPTVDASDCSYQSKDSESI